MTIKFLIFQYFLHKRGFVAQGLVTVRRPTMCFLLKWLGIQTCKTDIMIMIMIMIMSMIMIMIMIIIMETLFLFLNLRL